MNRAVNLRKKRYRIRDEVFEDRSSLKSVQRSKGIGQNNVPFYRNTFREIDAQNISRSKISRSLPATSTLANLEYLV